MRTLSRILRPRLEATAHCDLPCGVYDPAQARIEAESVKAIQEKYQGNDDPEFRDARHPDQGAARRPGQAPPVGAVDRLLQAAALREVPGAARAVQQGHQEGRRRRRRRQVVHRPGHRPGAARPDRRRSTRSSGRRRPPRSQKLQSGADQRIQHPSVGVVSHLWGGVIPTCGGSGRRDIDHSAAAAGTATWRAPARAGRGGHQRCVATRPRRAWAWTQPISRATPIRITTPLITIMRFIEPTDRDGTARRPGCRVRDAAGVFCAVRLASTKL